MTSLYIFFLAIIELSCSVANRKPNILLYIVDDVGWADIGAYGSKYYETPHIDKLAERGMMFTRGYAASPSCSPTRASILTGLYPSRFRITLPDCHMFPQRILPSGYQKSSPTHLPYICPESVRYLDPAVNTLSKALRAAKYRTAHFGKWHLGRAAEHWPEHYGFEVAWHGAPDSGPAMPNGYHSPYTFKEGTIPSEGPAGEYLVDRLTDEVISYIRHNNKEPFFASVAQFGVHPPLQSPSEKETLRFAKKVDPSGVHSNPIMGAMLKSVDDSVGKIVAELERQAILNDTIIFFVSDNGGNAHMTYDRFTLDGGKDPNISTVPTWLQVVHKHAGNLPPTNNFPLRGSKGSLYEGGVRVPFIATWMGTIPAGVRSTQLISTVDIFPTIMDIMQEFLKVEQRSLKSGSKPLVRTSSLGKRFDMARSKLRARSKLNQQGSFGQSIMPNDDLRFDGISLKSVLLNEVVSVNRSALFAVCPHGPVRYAGASVTTGSWKLIRRFAVPVNRTLPYELYNLDNDISESNDLAIRFPSVVSKLEALLSQFIANTNSLMPIPNPRYNHSEAVLLGLA